MTTPTARELDGFPRPERVTATTTYTWNDFDRLTRIERPSNTQANTYDAGGIRKRKVGSDGVAVKSFYSGLPAVSESESSSGGTSEVSYLMGHQLLGFEKDGQFFYFITDGLSSVRALLNGSGTVVGEVAHDEFGNRAFESGTTPSKTYVGGLGVTDEIENTELMYMRQRWYDPGLGRFLSQDPIGFAGGWNQYIYTENSPVNLVDPTGLNPGLLWQLLIWGMRTAPAVTARALPALSSPVVLGLGEGLLAPPGYPGSPASLMVPPTKVTPPAEWAGAQFEKLWQLAGPPCRETVSDLITLSRTKFRDTFVKHSQNTDLRFLLQRARGSGMPMGQWLDDQAAAAFIMQNSGRLAHGVIEVTLPSGVPARVILPSGAAQVTSRARLVPLKGGIEAYPIPEF